MRNIIKAVQSALDNKNYTAALMITLTIPDICGQMEGKKAGAGRYIAWYEKYLKPKYKDFLSGNDCYALRCALLHQGSDDISDQRKKEVLQLFYFVTKGPHCNQFLKTVFGCKAYDTKNVLQISVFHFCDDFIKAVTQWLDDTTHDSKIQENLSSLFKIHEPGEQIGCVQIGIPEKKEKN